MIADLIVAALAFYAAAGSIFAAWFVTSGVNRFDPAARKSGWAFRALIIPGTAALWPVMWRKLR